MRACLHVGDIGGAVAIKLAGQLRVIVCSALLPAASCDDFSLAADDHFQVSLLLCRQIFHVQFCSLQQKALLSPLSVPDRQTVGSIWDWQFQCLMVLERSTVHGESLNSLCRMSPSPTRGLCTTVVQSREVSPSSSTLLRVRLLRSQVPATSPRYRDR